MHTRSVLSETVDQLIGRTLMPFSRRRADRELAREGREAAGIVGFISRIEARRAEQPANPRNERQN